MVFSLIVGEDAALVLSSARASVVGGMASKKKGRRERFQTREERERERERESSVPPFGFPAPLVALLAGKDDDEDTKEGLEALTVMEIQTRTRRRGCGHNA